MTVTQQQHPAKFSRAVLDVIKVRLPAHPIRILDPFAGVGKVHALHHNSVGVELEPEWANMHPQNIVGNALELPFRRATFDALVTSPCYGNRISDSFQARDGSKRNTYHHQLGRRPSHNSAAVLQWGPNYHKFHDRAWREALRVMKPEAQLFVNVSNHVRADKEMYVVEYHIAAFARLGCTLNDVVHVKTPRNRFGAHGDKRVDGERVLVMQAP